MRCIHFFPLLLTLIPTACTPVDSPKELTASPTLLVSAPELPDALKQSTAQEFTFECTSIVYKKAGQIILRRDGTSSGPGEAGEAKSTFNFVKRNEFTWDVTFTGDNAVYDGSLYLGSTGNLLLQPKGDKSKPVSLVCKPIN